MDEPKTIELRIKLNDFTSPVVATFKVPVDTPINDALVGQAIVHLTQMVNEVMLGDGN
jgi:hypothetical protein